MSTITFNLRLGLGRKAQDTVIDEIAGLPGVKNVGRIASGIEDPTVNRMCFAEVDSGATDNIRKLLKTRVDIEFAEEPSHRFAI